MRRPAQACWEQREDSQLQIPTPWNSSSIADDSQVRLRVRGLLAGVLSTCEAGLLACFQAKVQVQVEGVKG